MRKASREGCNDDVNFWEALIGEHLARKPRESREAGPRNRKKQSPEKGGKAKKPECWENLLAHILVVLQAHARTNAVCSSTAQL